ncbi:hypothetical protein RIF29_38223 [Crotalaria pallida]|uniref:Ubiquitin-like protease family profile domain-containing protein n=1 Tax=Crotalaria pallida TaxID=3830 RepID=A0AAN9E563_CROPI
MQKPPRFGGGQSNCTQFQSTPNASKGKAVNIGSLQNRNTPKQKSVSIPRVMKPMFKPPTDINFTLSKAMMFAFIFGEDMELCEPLVFTAYAMKVALTQKYSIHASKLGTCLCHSVYIYVPFIEDDHWYLMVVSIRDSTVYHCEALYNMMTSDAFGESDFHTPFDLDIWPIDIARGVLKMGTSPNKYGEYMYYKQVLNCLWLKEMIVRIITALMMAMDDPFNQQKIKIEQEAAKRWEKFT